jgi:hypothetical protein
MTIVAAVNVAKFFKAFPDLEEDASNARYDLCEVERNVVTWMCLYSRFRAVSPCPILMVTFRLRGCSRHPLRPDRTPR